VDSEWFPFMGKKDIIYSTGYIETTENGSPLFLKRSS
jgi:hypothetical protein